MKLKHLGDSSRFAKAHGRMCKAKLLCLEVSYQSPSLCVCYRDEVLSFSLERVSNLPLQKSVRLSDSPASHLTARMPGHAGRMALLVFYAFV